MLARPLRAACASARLLAAALALGAICAPAAARAGDVVLDNFTATSKTGDIFTIKHAEFVNTNLTHDEIVKLLTPDTPVDEEKALAKKMTADKISIPLVDVTLKKGGVAHLHDLLASKVAAGRVGTFTMSGADGSGAGEKGSVAFKSGALEVEDADLSNTLPATAAEGGRGRLGHMSWKSFDVVAPQDAGGTVHIALGALEMKSDYDGDVIKNGATTLTALVIEPSPGSKMANSLAAFGYSKIELGAVVGARYDKGAQTLSLDDFTIEGVKMGSVGLKANFEGVGPELFSADKTGRLQALLAAGVSSIQIKLANDGLFEKSLAFAAKQRGSTPAALQKQWAAAAGQMLPLFLGGDAAAIKTAAEVQKFIGSPKTLKVSVRAKSGALHAADFAAMANPMEIAGKLDISAIANQ